MQIGFWWIANYFFERYFIHTFWLICIHLKAILEGSSGLPSWIGRVTSLSPRTGRVLDRQVILTGTTWQGNIPTKDKNKNQVEIWLPSRKLTYPTFGKGKSCSKVPLKDIHVSFQEDMPHMSFTTSWCVNTYSFTFNLDQLLIVDTKFWHTPNRPSQHEPMLLGPKGSERVWHYKPNLSLKKNMHFCCISDRKNIWKNMAWETCLTLMIRFSSCQKK